MFIKKKVYGSAVNQTIVIFPHWNAGFLDYSYLCNYLSKKYHVIQFNYSVDILTADIQNSIQAFDIIAKNAISTLEDLHKKKHTISIIGFSIGSFIACLCARYFDNVDNIYLITSAARFSEFVWYSNKTTSIKNELQKNNIDYAQLKDAYKNLDPLTNLAHTGANVFLALGQEDMTIPYPLGKDLIGALERGPHTVAIKIHPAKNHKQVLMYYQLQPHVMLRLLKRQAKVT